MSEKNIYDIIIVGAGASGLVAGIVAARQGKKVLILEQKDKIGKKILATGNGKCNFTNSYMDESCFYGDRTLVNNVLRQFSHEDCLSFFRGLGIYPKNKNGYYYPNSEQAASLVFALELEAKRLHIEIVCSAQVTQLLLNRKGFQISYGTQSVIGKKIILATGLLANPKLGSDGSIFPEIKALGHHFSPIVPALCGFYAKGIPFKKVAGVRADANLTLYIENSKKKSEHGELQLVEYGISGIPVFQISREASLALYEKKMCEVAINFLPELSYNEVKAEIVRRCKEHSGMTAGEMLNGLLNHKLIGVLLDKAEIAINDSAGLLKEKQIRNLCNVITTMSVTLTKARDYEFAQVCAGGIRTDEIDVTTLESQLVDGLYFAGELLDVDGICGGYNLQWAWASGYMAGISASK